MATAIPGFNAAEFRDGIHTAMLMALPSDATRRPRFVTVAVPAASADADPDGVPWALDQPMALPDTQSERALCAIEMHERSEETKRFGPLQPGQIEVTLLDEDYAKVEGFKYVELWTTLTGPPVRYYYRRILLQTYLDSVGVWVLECATEDAV